MAKKHKGSKGNQNLPEKSGFKAGREAEKERKAGIEGGGGNKEDYSRSHRDYETSGNEAPSEPLPPADQGYALEAGEVSPGGDGSNLTGADLSGADLAGAADGGEGVGATDLLGGKQPAREAAGDVRSQGDWGDIDQDPKTKNFNSSKSNTSSVSEAPVGNGGGGGDSSTVAEELASGVADGGEGVGATDLLGGKQPAREAAGDWNSTRSNTTSVKSGGGGGPGKPVPDSATAIEYGLIAAEAPGGGGGKEPIREAGDSRWVIADAVRIEKGLSGGGSGSGLVKRTVGKTLGMAKTVIMAAVLISVAGAGVDVYQTYNDAIAIDLEKHITDADFELSDDKSEISGSVGFDIPEMGMRGYSSF